MADDKRKRGSRDRATVSASETYELSYFADKHGLSQDEAQGLIDRVGNSRVALEAEVAKKAPRRSKAPARKAADSGGSADNRKRTKRQAPAPRNSREPARGGLGIEEVSGAAAQRTTAVTEPIAQAVAPLARRAATAGRKARAVTRRGTASMREAAEVAPKAAVKGTSGAVDGVKSTVTSRTAALVGAAAAGLVTGLAVNLGRKALVQAPSAIAGDWFEAVKLEHRLALTLFDQLQATTDQETGKRSALLTQLKHALGKHAFMEENVLYPALRAWGDKADADKLNHDHGYVKQNLYDLEEMDNGASTFLQKVGMFRAEIEAHIREEEDAIFPPLHAALGDARNAKVTAQANKEGFKLA
jgi:hemerythrin superfamily protein